METLKVSVTSCKQKDENSTVKYFNLTNESLQIK
jgi:hypothetical protein